MAVLTMGSLFLRMFKIGYGNNTEKMIYRFAAGNLVYSAIFIYLGIFHILYGKLALAFYLMPIFYLLKYFFSRSLYKNLFEWIKKFWGYEWKTSTILMIVLILIPFLVLFPSLFVFPTSWDALAYHLPLPKIYLQDHFFSYYNWFPQMASPVGIESLFGLGEILNEPRLSNFIVFSFLVAIVVYVLQGLRYLLPHKILLLGLFLFLFRRILFSEVSVTPYVDFPFAFYGLILSVTLIKFIRVPKISTLVFILSLSVFSFMFKYLLGFVVLLSTSIVLLFYFLTDKNIVKKLLKEEKTSKVFFAGTLIIFFIPVIYWLLRNYIYFKNPTYPIFNDIFQGLDYDQTSYQANMADLRGGSLDFNLLSRLFLGFPINSDILYESLMTLPLVLLPIVGLFSRQKIFKVFSIFGLAFIFPVFLMLGFPSHRYIFFATPSLSLAASYVFWNLFKSRITKFRFLFIGGLLVIFITQFLRGLNDAGKFFLNSYKFSLRAIQSYEKAVNGKYAQDNYAGIYYVNHNLDKQKNKVLITLDNRIYYFDVPVMYANPSMSGIFTSPKNEQVEDIQENIVKNGITHVFINYNWGTHPLKNKELFYAYIDKYLELIASSSGTFVYKVK